MSSVLLTAVVLFNTFLETFPYAIVGWHMFLYVVIPFEILLIVLKVFLGSRAIGQHNQ